MDSIPHRPQYRFGPFDVDAAAGELRKHGTRIKLQKQPFLILVALLERPQEVLSRDELRQKIWTGDTFVDFEHGLNAAMNKLRQALADTPENPRYIETVPGAGYRMLVPVEVAPRSGEAEPPALSSALRPQSKRWVLLIGVGVAFAAFGWLARPFIVPSAPPLLIKFTIAPPEGFSWELALTRQDFAISPDGARLAFVASDAAKSHLWVRNLSSLASYPVAPDRNVRGVVWAPDSHSLYFDELTTLRHITLEDSPDGGGAAQTIANLPLGAPWMGLLRGLDLILYTRAGSFAVSPSHGTVKRIDDLPHQWTQGIAGGYLLSIRYDDRLARYRAFATRPGQGATGDGIVETDSRVLFAPLSPGLAKGHLLYVRAGTLLAHPFDAGTRRPTGDPWAIAEKVFNFTPTGAAAFTVSENGVLVYRTGPKPVALKWVDRGGGETASPVRSAALIGGFRLSADGSRLAASVYNVERGGMEIWLYDMSDGTARRLTTGAVTEALPVWSPDGSRIAYGRAAGATPKLFWRKIEGASDGEPLPPARFQLPTDWSRDGRFILYQTTGGIGEPGSDVAVVDLLHDRKVVPLLQSESQECDAVFSPLGSAIAFISDHSGRPELYLQEFHADPVPTMAGEKRQVSRDGASVIRWRADGKEIYYVSLDDWLTAVAIEGPGLQRIGPARRLFHVNLPPRSLTSAGPNVGLDVSADGKRFLVPDHGAVGPSPFVVIVNWPELTRARTR